MLQWGRDLTVADSAKDAAVYAQRSWLQWGRDLTVADSPSIGQPLVYYISFNGAAI